MNDIFKGTLLGAALLVLGGCAASRPPVDIASSYPGTMVTLRGEPQRLSGAPLLIGDHLPDTILVNAFTLEKTVLAEMRGNVLIISVVPSLDTKVCEAQTHYLGEEGASLPPEIKRITISRDTPFAQKRFAQESRLTDIIYLSDYRDASFGSSTGLLQEDSMLLARAVLVADREGVLRYLQVVPELTHLPNMEAAFVKARELTAR